MTFDMTQCKIGDKLKIRGGGQAEYTSYDSSNSPYCWWVDDKISVDKDGYRYWEDSPNSYDIIGFWEAESSEKEEQPTDTEPTFPNVEPRTPHVSKVVYYRLHMNEIYHRDITQEEAEAIYEQLKTLLGK